VLAIPPENETFILEEPLPFANMTLPLVVDIPLLVKTKPVEGGAGGVVAKAAIVTPAL
jgi:hypothetical protein